MYEAKEVVFAEATLTLFQIIAVKNRVDEILSLQMLKEVNINTLKLDTLKTPYNNNQFYAILNIVDVNCRNHRVFNETKNLHYKTADNQRSCRSRTSCRSERS